MRLSSSKEDAVIGKAPLRSGYQPDKPTDEIRQLQKEVKQIMREKGIDDQRSPAERWKTALDAVKTRLKNQIADLTKQLETGAKTPAKKGIEYDAEAKALQKVRDDLKGALEKVEGKQKLTDEQRVKIAMEAAEKSLKEYQRRFVNKDFSPRETAKTPETPELKKLREQRDNAKEEYERQKKEAENLANPPKSKEEIATEAAIKSNKKSIEEKERRIKENDLSPSPKKEVADANNKELKDLRDKSDALDKQLQQMRNDAKVKKTEAEKTLERTKKSIEDLEKKIKDKDLADKIKSGVTTPEIEAAREKREKLAEELEKLKNEADPYREERKALEEWRKRKAAEIENKKDKLEKLKKGVLPEPPKPKVIPTSSEDLKIQAEAKKYKQDIDNEIARIKSANRSNFEKGLEWVSNWRRFAVLTGYHVLGKLAAAGVWQNAVVTPARKIIQTGLGKIPGLRGVAEKAPTEGNYSIQALSENYAQWFKKAAWDDVVNTAKTGKSQVKILNGNNEYHDKHFTDFIGNAHAAIKVLPERGEYFSSVQSASEWALRQGMDLTKPATQEMIHEIAYDNAQRNIFNNKNALSDGYKQMINHIAEKGGVGGRIAKTLLFDENLPIVKVPINVLNDATSYTMGAVKAFVTGIETKFKVDNMTPEQADSIMRNLGKQTIGLIGLGVAKYLYHNLAGFYNKGEKKEMSGVEADKLKPGDVKVGDFKISHNFLHHPAFYGAQIAANIQRLMEAHASDKKKEGKEPFSLGDAILKSVSSVIKEIPMLESAASTFDVLKDTKSFKKALVETYVAGQIPQGLKEVAKDTDPEDKRSPQNVGQQLESNVPGLRESVPIPKDDFRDKNSWNKEKTYVVKGKQYIYDNNYWHLKK